MDKAFTRKILPRNNLIFLAIFLLAVIFIVFYELQLLAKKQQVASRAAPVKKLCPADFAFGENINCTVPDLSCVICTGKSSDNQCNADAGMAWVYSCYKNKWTYKETVACEETCNKSQLQSLKLTQAVPPPVEDYPLSDKDSSLPAPQEAVIPTKYIAPKFVPPPLVSPFICHGEPINAKFAKLGIVKDSLVFADIRPTCQLTLYPTPKIFDTACHTITCTPTPIQTSSENICQQTATCIKPATIVIHWNGSFGVTASLSKSVLEKGAANYFCQLVTDSRDQLALQNFYSDSVEMPKCSGVESNLYTINNEISGVCFDEVLYGLRVPEKIIWNGTIVNPQLSLESKVVQKDVQRYSVNDLCGIARRYPDIETVRFARLNSKGEITQLQDIPSVVADFRTELEQSTIKALSSTCNLMKQYSIPVENVRGHNELTYLDNGKEKKMGKLDPGEEYISYFRQWLLEGLADCNYSNFRLPLITD